MGGGSTCRRKTAGQGGGKKAERKRRPVGFWQVFNDWFRAELVRLGRRPVSHEVVKWYADNAHLTWENPEDRPTWKETRVHAKCLRSIEEVKMYFRRYRKSKTKQDEDGSNRSDDDDDEEEDDGDDEEAMSCLVEPSHLSASLPGSSLTTTFNHTNTFAVHSSAGVIMTNKGASHMLDPWQAAPIKTQRPSSLFPDSSDFPEALTARYYQSAAHSNDSFLQHATAITTTSGGGGFTDSDAALLSPFARMTATPAQPASNSHHLPPVPPARRLNLAQLILPGGSGARGVPEPHASPADGGGDGLGSCSVATTTGRHSATSSQGSFFFHPDSGALTLPDSAPPSSLPHSQRSQLMSHLFGGASAVTTGPPSSSTHGPSSPLQPFFNVELLPVDDRWDSEPISPATLDELNQLLFTPGAADPRSLGLPDSQGEMRTPGRHTRPPLSRFSQPALFVNAAAGAPQPHPLLSISLPPPASTPTTDDMMELGTPSKVWDLPGIFGVGAGQQQQRAEGLPGQLAGQSGMSFHAGDDGGNAFVFGGTRRRPPPVARRSDPGPLITDDMLDLVNDAFGLHPDPPLDRSHHSESWCQAAGLLQPDPCPTHSVFNAPVAAADSWHSADAASAVAEAAAYMQLRCTEYVLEGLADSCGLPSLAPALRRVSEGGSGGSAMAEEPPLTSPQMTPVAERPCKRLACDASAVLLPPLPPVHPRRLSMEGTNIDPELFATSPHCGNRGRHWGRSHSARATPQRLHPTGGATQESALTCTATATAATAAGVQSRFLLPPKARAPTARRPSTGSDGPPVDVSAWAASPQVTCTNSASLAGWQSPDHVTVQRSAHSAAAQLQHVPPSTWTVPPGSSCSPSAEPVPPIDSLPCDGEWGAAGGLDDMATLGMESPLMYSTPLFGSGMPF